MKPKLMGIRVEHIIDKYPDTSFLGEYSNQPEEGAIDLWERYRNKRTYRYFNPCNPEYGEQDLQEMEAYNAGDFNFIGIKAIATIGFDYDAPNNINKDQRFQLTKTLRLSEEVESMGIWGVYDTDEASVSEYNRQEIADLRSNLKRYGIRWNAKMAQKATEKPIKICD